ncbi:MAG: hypothetical protein N2442_14520 [Spirochaetes bacterium]|nr:hypothetical protein [Spirochaetota bacterium]
MEIELFSRKFLFPTITDSQFESLQMRIAQTRKLYEEGSTERKAFFGLKKLPPRLSPEERLSLMEMLVEHYQELIRLLKQKIEACREAFQEVGEGVREMFQEKIEQLQELEERRQKILNRLRSEGKKEVAATLELQQEQLRVLAQNLARACILIIRKLRHALEALSLLAEDEEAQKEVLRSLQNDVDTYRNLIEFNRDLEALRRDISEITRTALNFDDLLSKSIGPLSLLIEEISKTDRRVAESLAEIQRISLELENQTQIMDEFTIGDRILDLLVASHLKRDVIDSLIESITSPSSSLDEVEFDLKIAEAKVKDPTSFDFQIFAQNITSLVERGLLDLYRVTPEQVHSSKRVRSRKLPTNTGMAETVIPLAVDPIPKEREAIEEGKLSEAEAEIEGTTQTSIDAHSEEEPMEKTKELPSGNEQPSASSETSLSSEQSLKPSPPAANGEDKPEKVLLKYRTPVSRANPTLVLFLLDMSGSMEESFQGKVTKAEFLAHTVDRTLEELVVRCRKADGVRDYFHIGCLGFGDGKVWSLLPLEPKILPISQLAQSPRTIQQDASELPHPSWVLPHAEGNTPLRAAFREVCYLVGDWCDAHFSSYPPTVILITDGMSTDGTPEEESKILKQLHTSDGEALLFCLHIATGSKGEILFPSCAPLYLDTYGQFLFEISSPMPLHVRQQASRLGYRVEEGSRFFAYGASPERMADFFDLGTRPAQLL